LCFFALAPSRCPQGPSGSTLFQIQSAVVVLLVRLNLQNHLFHNAHITSPLIVCALLTALLSVSLLVSDSSRLETANRAPPSVFLSTLSEGYQAWLCEVPFLLLLDRHLASLDIETSPRRNSGLPSLRSRTRRVGLLLLEDERTLPPIGSPEILFPPHPGLYTYTPFALSNHSLRAQPRVLSQLFLPPTC